MNDWGPYANFIYDVEIELSIKAVLGRKPEKPHLPQKPHICSPTAIFSTMSSILNSDFPKSDTRVLEAQHQ